jgi:hypothetical protein
VVSICQKHQLPFDIKLISLSGMDAAKLWMIEHQLGQRNLIDEQGIYWIGKHYELEKKLQHRPGNNGTKVVPLRTREEIGKRHRVSQQTVANAAQFTRAIDTIADNIGDGARTEILDGDLKLTRQEVHLRQDSPLVSLDAAVSFFSR